MLYPNYVITTPSNFRPKFAMPTAKKVSSQKRLRYHIAYLLNFANIPACVLNKIQTHSLQGFSKYFKKHTLDKYDPVCHILNCYICS